MTTSNTDLEAIAAEPTSLTLESGFPIKVERLKTRALMSLLKILTRGLGDFITTIRFSDTDEEELQQQLVAAVVFSIPEAQDETIEFINRMVSPAQSITGRALSKGEIAFNQDLERQLRDQLEDPELEDLLTIVQAIVELEAPHLVALGKRLSALLPMASRLTPASESEQKPLNDSSTSVSETSTQEDL